MMRNEFDILTVTLLLWLKLSSQLKLLFLLRTCVLEVSICLLGLNHGATPVIFE